jgi:Ser/Thr protein kinase RdoA (MazF antagonist)
VLTAVAPAGALLAADPVLAHRDLLLDPDAVADRLAASLGSDGPLRIDRCTPVRRKYRIGESLRVSHLVTIGGREHRVTARMFPAGRAAHAGGAAGGGAAGAVGDGLRPVHLDAAIDTVWWTFPHDRRLHGLHALLRPPPDLARLVPGPWRAGEVAEYAPERSLTVRAHDDAGGTVAYAKAYAPGTADVVRLADRYRRVAAALARRGGPVATPGVLGASPERGVLLLAAAPGVSWRALPEPAQPAALALLGRGIATLHGLCGPVAGPALGLRAFARLRPPRLGTALDVVARARPEHAAATRRLRAPLLAGPPVAEEPVLLHGDCHPGNALFDGDRLTLIDLDQSGTGPAAADLGSLLARLRHGCVVGEHDARTGDELAAAFLDGYAAVRPLPDPRSLAWHTAAALVAERALRAVNRVHGPALTRLDHLLRAAEDTLRTGALP